MQASRGWGAGLGAQEIQSYRLQASGFRLTVANVGRHVQRLRAVPCNLCISWTELVLSCAGCLGRTNDTSKKL